MTSDANSQAAPTPPTYAEPATLPPTPRVTLIHNERAAGRFRMSTARILELLGESGYAAEHVPTDDEADLEAALRDPGDLVVAAGGDGTVRGVALTLAQLGSSAPLAPLPLGTANNIARTLGLVGTTEELLRGLATPYRRPFDLGCVRAPWGEAHFLEAFGVGLFAHGMAQYDPEGGKSLLRAARAAFGTFWRYEARDYRLELGGEDYSGRYLMLEVMNTAAMGLRLHIAPGADPSDGLFDVMLVREDETVSPFRYLRGFASSGLDGFPNVLRVRTDAVKLLWDGLPLHFDEEVRGDDESDNGRSVRGGDLTLTLQPGALTLWLPHPT